MPGFFVKITTFSDQSIVRTHCLNLHQGDVDFISDDSFFTTGDGHIKANRVALLNLNSPWPNCENTACYIKCVLLNLGSGVPGIRKGV